jgi:hypothetical protein
MKTSKVWIDIESHDSKTGGAVEAAQHEQSVLAWDMFSERCKVGRAERRKIKERHENRFKKEEK